MTISISSTETIITSSSKPIGHYLACSHYAGWKNKGKYELQALHTNNQEVLEVGACTVTIPKSCDLLMTVLLHLNMSQSIQSTAAAFSSSEALELTESSSSAVTTDSDIAYPVYQT